ncbi:MAG: portal protein [Hyphomonadaceae bacterium]
MSRHAEMEAERANWDSLWERIAELVFPRSQFFTTKSLTQGDLRGERVFDNTPALALDKFAAAIGSMLTPETMQWHGLKISDPALAEVEEVKEYLELVARLLFQQRYAPRTNFSSQTHECWLSNGAFGTSALFVDEAMGSSLRYRAMHLSEIYIGENHQGQIDRVHRGRFELKAYQVEQLANLPEGDPRRWVMPECVKKALSDVGGKANPNATFEFIHCVYPNEQWMPGFADYRGMAWSSVYVCVADRSITNVSGYRTMPYAVSRYVTGPRETYGRSPAMTVFRDILMLNEMNKSVIRAAQLHVDPPFLLSEEGAATPFSMAPRALNYGYMNDDGSPLAQSLRPDGDLVVGLELIQDRRTAINDAFLITLFRILVENPNQTATEALLRAQEKGQLLGPTLGRQQSEFLSAVIEREIDILSAAGVLPPPPDILLEAGEAGVAIEFKSPLNRLQRADDAVGIIRGIEALQPLAAINPRVYDLIDPVRAARVVFEANGAPADVIRSDDQIAEMDEQQQQQADLEMMMQAAPAGAKAIKDLAGAQALSQNVPRALPPPQ